LFKLLAVKCELEHLCKTCEKKPELFVVPGNHDVALWGNVRMPLASRWFDTIMFGNTVGAKEQIERSLGVCLGINEECRRLSIRRRLKRLSPRNSIWGSTLRECDGRLQSRSRRTEIWPTVTSYNSAMIVCFSSNPSISGMATGEIDHSQLASLTAH